MLDTRPVPCDYETEKYTLGFMLCNTSLIEDVRGKLDPLDFYATENQKIYECFLDGITDILVIHDKLRNIKNVAGEQLVTAGYLASLDDGCYNRHSIDDYVFILKKKRLARDVMERGLKMVDDVGKDWKEFRDSIESSSEQIAKLYEQARYLNFEKVVDQGKLVESYLDARFNPKNQKPKIPIAGWHEFNRKLGGGFKRGRVYVIAARPSTGKTSFVVHLCAQFCLQGLPGLMFQVENPEFDIWDKMAANICTYDSEAIADDPSYMTPERKERIEDAVRGLSHTFCIEHRDRADIDEIVQRITAYHRQRKIQWFVVDYLQRIQGDGRRNDLENITRNIRILDSLAEKLDVVCILISMANRDSEGGKIRMKHMKGSGEIEQDADVLIALQSNEQQIDSDIEDQDVEVLKNRHGRKGKIPMRFMKASSQYTEIGSEFR